jgi:hypothetical protein
MSLLNVLHLVWLVMRGLQTLRRIVRRGVAVTTTTQPLLVRERMSVVVASV